MTAEKIQKEFRALRKANRSKESERFFKTGKGEYGEGDKFLGITVPETRNFAKKYKDISTKELEILLQSPWHEERLLALVLLAQQYKKEPEKRESIYRAYTKNIGTGINNWDLVDVSAPHIVGAHLEKTARNDLYALAASKNLWKMRVAIIATFHFIRLNDFQDTLNLCEIFLKEKHDLMHKACGWMLREVGKKEIDVLRNFLKKHAKSMPRTMLRYAIERLPKEEREVIMKKTKAHQHHPPTKDDNE